MFIGSAHEESVKIGSSPFFVRVGFCVNASSAFECVKSGPRSVYKGRILEKIGSGAAAAESGKAAKK